MQTASAAEGRQLAIVTGSNTGIGYHVAGLLAARGFHVILACRSAERANKAIETLHADYGNEVSIEYQALDLSSFESVQAFASRIVSAYSGGLQLLVCNAGLNAASVSQQPEQQLTKDGVDVVYQTNFLSHLLLIKLLLPMLQAAREPGGLKKTGRVVSLSSVIHRASCAADLALTRQIREPYVSLYGFSKLAQIAIGVELHRQYGSEVAFHCINPGGVSSDIWRGYPAWQQWLMSTILVSPEKAARTVVAACVCEEGLPPVAPMYLNGYRGAGHNTSFEYWSPLPADERLVFSKPSADAQSSEFGQRLWEDSLDIFRAAGLNMS